VVPEESPVTETEWLVTKLDSSELCEPYVVSRPYSTCDVAPLSVVQVIVASALVTDPEETEMILAGATTGIEWLRVLNSSFSETSSEALVLMKSRSKIGYFGSVLML
ncbi:MAG: hypothetical protein ACEQR6_03025, partial [Burkholderiaceae bacterium]